MARKDRIDRAANKRFRVETRREDRASFYEGSIVAAAERLARKNLLPLPVVMEELAAARASRWQPTQGLSWGKKHKEAYAQACLARPEQIKGYGDLRVIHHSVLVLKMMRRADAGLEALVEQVYEEVDDAAEEAMTSSIHYREVDREVEPA